MNRVPSHKGAGRMVGGRVTPPSFWVPFPCCHYLLPALAAHRGRFGLQLYDGTEQGISLILGEGDVGIIMQAKDLRHVVEWEALDVGEVALRSRRVQLKPLPVGSPLIEHFPHSSPWL